MKVVIFLSEKSIQVVFLFYNWLWFASLILKLEKGFSKGFLRSFLAMTNWSNGKTWVSYRPVDVFEKKFQKCLQRSSYFCNFLKYETTFHIY